MLGYTLHIVGLSEGQTPTENEIRNPAFENICRGRDQIGIAEQVEADLVAKPFVSFAACHLTEPSTDECGAIMGSRPVAHPIAVDIIDQLDGKIRVAGDTPDFCKAIRFIVET